MLDNFKKYTKVVTETVPGKLNRFFIVAKLIMDSTLPLVEAFLAAKILNASVISAQQKQVSSDVFIYVGTLIALDILRRALDLFFGIIIKKI